MPRNYSNAPSGGTAASGRAYTPQVTPDNQEDDTANVTGGRNYGPDSYDTEYGAHRYEEHRAERNARQDRDRNRDRNEDVINRRDLQPTYEVMDRTDRDDYRRGRDDESGDNRPRERWHGAASRPHSFDDRRDRDRDEERRVADNNYGFGNPPAEGRRGLDAARDDDEPDYMRRRHKEGLFEARSRRGDDDRDPDWDDGFRNAYPTDRRR